MLPENGDDLQQAFTLARQPGLTFGLDFQAGRVTGDHRRAGGGAAGGALALQTERFFYEIFTPAYGSELHALVGTARRFRTPSSGRPLPRPFPWTTG